MNNITRSNYALFYLLAVVALAFALYASTNLQASIATIGGNYSIIILLYVLLWILPIISFYIGSVLRPTVLGYIASVVVCTVVAIACVPLFIAVAMGGGSLGVIFAILVCGGLINACLLGTIEVKRRLNKSVQ